VFDLNDFDEVTFGPWEFDLKRLVASVNVAGRGNGLNAKERREAVMRSVEGASTLTARKSMPILDVRHLHTFPDRIDPMAQPDAKSVAIFRKATKQARERTNATLLREVAH
jgi:uncharacterized protein (DUF2252 family)